MAFIKLVIIFIKDCLCDSIQYFKITVYEKIDNYKADVIFEILPTEPVYVNQIKISGAVSMDDTANPTAIGDMEQQMINCYADLKKILEHYNASFDDVVVENIFTTDMNSFLEVASYRNKIYTKHFPTGSWLGVKELAFPEFMIEIELEVHLSNN